ncbi:MAG: hypothetical protein SNJ83_14435 [Aggregatilineales bacterium]
MKSVLKKGLLVAVSVSVLSVASLAAQSAITYTPQQAVNVRSGPGITFTVRTVTTSELVVTGKSSDFNVAEACSGGMGDNQNAERWLRVETALGEGWVWRCAGVVRGDAAGLPIVSPSLPVSISDSARTTRALTGDLLPSNVTEGVEAFVTAASANVRQSPSITSERIGVLAASPTDEPATRIRAVGRNAAGTWIQVSYVSGDSVVTGWMARFLLLLPSGWPDSVPVK